MQAVRRPNQNILRALLLGTQVVTGVYVLVNLAAIAALGLAKLPSPAWTYGQPSIGSSGPQSSTALALA